MERKFRIGISSCLLGNEVRWNSGHKHDKYLTRTLGRFVDYVPVCPEVEAGFGVPRESFDGRGNYTLAFREQTVFPEIDYDKIDKVRGLEVSIITTAKTDEEGRTLLELLGMPFALES